MNLSAYSRKKIQFENKYELAPPKICLFILHVSAGKESPECFLFFEEWGPVMNLQ